MHYSRLVVILSAAVAPACSGSRPATSASQGGSLLQLLPRPAAFAAGLTRQGSEADVAAALRMSMALSKVNGPVQIPECALGALAKVEAIAAAVDVSAQPPAVTFAVRGAGLRPALESCVKTLFPKFDIVNDRGVTSYKLSASGRDKLSVVWLNDDALVAGPMTDASATARLASVAEPLTGDSRLMQLVSRADPTKGVWFALDVSALEKWMPPRSVHPQSVWGRLAGPALEIELECADADTAAEKIFPVIRQFIGSNTAGLTIMAESTVNVDGPLVRFRMPVRKLLAQSAGVEAEDIPESGLPIATVGVMVAVLVPEFAKMSAGNQ